MNFRLKNYTGYVFILGAGASVDYGLPTWKELSSLIKNKIKNDIVDQYKYKQEMLNWLEKIGEGKKYKTIDECIKFESVSKDYHNNGHKIEDEIFRVVSEIFEGRYKYNEEGWIRLLNDKIKDSSHLKLEHRIAFINYNYDKVLDKNFLNFDHLGGKDKEITYADRLSELYGVKAKCLHPHGFFSGLEPESITKEADTIKTNKEGYIDVVSCYESKAHTIGLENLTAKMPLYILGLGGGLEINLKNTKFENKISEIHITIKDKEMTDEVKKTLIEKFNIDETDINVYEDCKDLINNCFN